MTSGCINIFAVSSREATMLQVPQENQKLLFLSSEYLLRRLAWVLDDFGN